MRVTTALRRPAMNNAFAPMTACAICEHGPTDATHHICDDCSDAPGQVRAMMGLHPEHAGFEAYIIVPKGTEVPSLAKAIPMDANLEGRIREGAPVSTGAFWSDPQTAQAALERYVTADVRATVEVRKVVLFFSATPAPALRPETTGQVEMELF
jgi:hypothetical protein